MVKKKEASVTVPLEEKTCDRCGDRFSYIEARERNGHTYFYAVHRIKTEEGRVKIHKCYLGPRGYYYVVLLHKDSGLPLTGILDKDRYIEYLESVLGHLASNELSREQNDRVKRLIKKYKGEF
jgi:hypothetical protein